MQRASARSQLPAVAFVLSLAALSAASSALADAHPNKRGGWYLGFGLGGGSLAITVPNATSDRTGGSAGSFRGGYVLNDQVALGYEGTAWTKSEAGATLTFSTGTATASYYPGAGGLVLRGGIGVGSANATVNLGGGTSVTGTESGLGLNLGAQYDFRLARTFALGPQIDFSTASFDKYDANFVNVGLSLNWYFIPR
jgi:hypothetical protein